MCLLQLQDSGLEAIEALWVGGVTQSYYSCLASDLARGMFPLHISVPSFVKWGLGLDNH